MGQSWDWQLAFSTHLVLVFVLLYPVSSPSFLISKKEVSSLSTPLQGQKAPHNSVYT